MAWLLVLAGTVVFVYGATFSLAGWRLLFETVKQEMVK